MNTVLYPQPPANVLPEKLMPSPAFRKQATKVIGAIVLFLIVYLLLITAAAILAIACVSAGIWIIVAMPKFLTLLLGAGLVAFAASVLFFLVKFMFSVTKDDKAGRVEITETEQPALFAFIRQLTTDTNTKFPRRIYISPDVNACVFYHSSFWSMFLPVRKNLEIGIGLVNSVNISEFKAVMAHEFGHFSQRSMKLGSFTYNANRIIYNMLYENNSYTSFLQSWANIHGILSLFAMLTVRIAMAIQYILRGMFQLINKSYMALSREMEFHADTIAASVAGGNNLVTALSRLEVANNCFSTAVSSASSFLKERKITRNIFSNQLTVFRSMAEEHDLPLKQGIPEVSYQFIHSFSRSRVNFKDQWASHPSLEERRKNMEIAAMDVAPDETGAWAIFNEAEDVQQIMTKIIYRDVKIEGDEEAYDAEEFNSWHNTQKRNYKLPAEYKGFYGRRYIDIKNWDLPHLANIPVKQTFDEFFNEENGQLPSSIISNQNDISTITAIKEKQIDVESFDFDGIKYQLIDCDQIIAQLEEEVKQQKEKLEELDKLAFAFFAQRGDKEHIIGLYKQFQVVTKRNDDLADIIRQLYLQVNIFYGNPTLEEVEAALAKIAAHEIIFKKELRLLITNDVINAASPGKLLEHVNKYVNSEYLYFADKEFKNDELDSLRQVIQGVIDEAEDSLFKTYKAMLEGQLK